MSFKNRKQAGIKLGEELKNRDIKPDLVLAIPRGGVPLGRKVADKLNTSLDIVVASKIGAPHNPELGIGAVASDGSYWLNEDLIESLDIEQSYIEKHIQKEAKNAREKLIFLRGKEELPELENKKVVLVDDGIATGGTVIACIRQIRQFEPEKLVLAVPVCPPDTVEKLKDEVDELIILETPKHFGSVGSFYDEFKQVTDKKAKEYLNS